jgi:single-strand DNA-binding protein
MNKCVFIGNLTRDPELKSTANGISVCRFTIAVSRKRAAEGQPSADFVDVVAWRALAENCNKYLKKGNKVCVCGAMMSRTYTNEEERVIKVWEVTAEEVEFLATAKNDNEQRKEAETTQLNEVASNDDIPF